MEGRLQTRSYEDKDGKKVYATDVVADDVILVGGRGEGGAPAEGQGTGSSGPRPSGGGSSRPQARPASHSEDPGYEMGVTDDDIPF